MYLSITMKIVCDFCVRFRVKNWLLLQSSVSTFGHCYFERCCSLTSDFFHNNELLLGCRSQFIADCRGWERGCCLMCTLPEGSSWFLRVFTLLFFRPRIISFQDFTSFPSSLLKPLGRFWISITFLIFSLIRVRSLSGIL